MLNGNKALIRVRIFAVEDQVLSEWLRIRSLNVSIDADPLYRCIRNHPSDLVILVWLHFVQKEKAPESYPFRGFCWEGFWGFTELLRLSDMQ